MKKHLSEFIRRGLMACGLGPVILAILYQILQQQQLLQNLTVNQVCLSILSLSLLAFIAGGMNVIYLIDRLPLAMAVLIHGGVLYVSYLATYLLNGWLEQGTTPFLVFSAIFLLGYLVIWAGIYFITKRRTAHLNQQLKQKQNTVENL